MQESSSSYSPKSCSSSFSVLEDGKHLVARFYRRSTRMTKIWALLRQSGSDRLEKRPTDLRQNTSYFGDRTLGPGLGLGLGEARLCNHPDLHRVTQNDTRFALSKHFDAVRSRDQYLLIAENRLSRDSC